MSQRVLVDATNLHVGGGVQVAASFVDELLELRQTHLHVYPWLAAIDLKISTHVSQELRTDLAPEDPIRIMDHRPHHIRRWLRHSEPYDAAFIVFGPHYGRLPSHRTLIGYADVTSVYPHPSGVPQPTYRRRILQFIRGSLSRRLLSRHDSIVTETESMRQRTLNRTSISAQRIHVVPNAYNSIFDHPESWASPIPEPWEGTRPDLVFAYVTRAYPHKNFNFIGRFLQSLECRGISATCLTTLNEEELQSLDELTRRRISNIGPLDLNRVPRLYQLSDAALFPSLLEAFSVMPLEAMRMGIPVVASDRDFVRTTAGTAPLYIDPLDPEGAANTVADSVRSETLQSRSSRGTAIVDSLPTAHERALTYLQMIDDLL